MTIRIPDFMFAQSTSQVTAPGEVSFETRNALATARSTEKEIASLNHGVSLASEVLKGGDKAQDRLLAARNALGAQGDSGALRWLLDHAAAEQARREGAASSRTAMRTLVGTIKAVGSLPVPFEMKAELGRHLVQQALRLGLVRSEDKDVFETATLSQFGLQQAQQEIAKASDPGQALAIVDAAKAEGSLLPHDAALLDSQAQERDAVATARHHARLAWKEQDDLAAFARGELPEPLSEDSFHLVHGARGAHGAQLRYQAARAEGEALVQIRGKDPAAIAEAEAAWQGDPTVFTAARSKDAAERQRDPVAYVIATQPDLEQALKEATPEESIWLLWQAQAAAGIPEGERSLWSHARQEALAAAWDAIPAHASGRTARLDIFRRHVQSLPPALRDAAIRTLVRQGITDGTEAELTQLVAELDDGRVNPARTLAAELTPAGTQVADQSDADESAVAEATAAPQDAEGATAPQGPIDWRSQGLPDAGTDAAWTMSTYEPSRQVAIAETLDLILALEIDPANLPSVEQEIRERLAGDDAAVDFFLLQARTLARAEGDDRITGDNRRTTARDLVSEARDRVIAGEPYDERWAELRPTLAKLEVASGLRLRPGAGPGLIAVFEPGRDDPTFSLPLPLAKVLADSPEALAEFGRLAGAVLRGEDVSTELDALAPKFIEVFEYTDEFGEHHRSTDTSAFDEINAAVDGARARLAEGMPPDEVFLHLMQVVLADELDDTDLTVVALQTALEFVPYYQYVEIGIGVADLVAALRAGNEDAAKAAAIVTALATIGSIPLLGPFAKSGLKWVGRKFGFIESAIDRSKTWLSQSQKLSPLDMGGVIARDSKDLLREFYGEGGDLTTKEFLGRFMQKAGIPKEKRDQIAQIFTTKIMPPASEVEVQKALQRFISETGFRLIPNKRAIKSGYGIDRSRPDFLIVPENISDEDLERIFKAAADEIDHTPFAILDPKTSLNDGTGPQFDLADKLNREGHLDVFVFYNMPQQKIRASSFAESVSAFFQGAGRTLTEQEQHMVRLVAEKVQRSLPGGTPAFHVFGMVFLGTTIALGLTYSISESESE